MRKLMKKAVVLLTTGVIAAVALTGCSKSNTENMAAATVEASETGSSGEIADVESDAKETEELKETSSGTVKVTSSYGETELPFNPKRVVVFDMGILDSMDYLGVDVELAVPTANLLDSLSKYKDVTNAGSIKEPDMEAVFMFEPDLIIISGRQEAFYEELNKIAPTWYASLDYQNLMEDFVDIYGTLGQIFGKEAEVSEAVRQIETKIGEITEKAGQSEEKALIVLTNDGNISAYGSGSRFGLIHDVLDVKTADAEIEASTHGQSVGYEYIAKVNPDILFVVDRTAIVAGTTGAAGTLNNELVESTNASKNDKIVYLNAENWYLAGTGLRTLPDMIAEVADALES